MPKLSSRQIWTYRAIIIVIAICCALPFIITKTWGLLFLAPLLALFFLTHMYRYARNGWLVSGKEFTKESIRNYFLIIPGALIVAPLIAYLLVQLLHLLYPNLEIPALRYIP